MRERGCSFKHGGAHEHRQFGRSWSTRKFTVFWPSMIYVTKISGKIAFKCFLCTSRREFRLWIAGMLDGETVFGGPGAVDTRQARRKAMGREKMVQPGRQQILVVTAQLWRRTIERKTTQVTNQTECNQNLRSYADSKNDRNFFVCQKLWRWVDVFVFNWLWNKF